MAPKTTVDWFKSITGWQQAVFSAIVLAFLLGATAFTYQNISLPKDSRRLDKIEETVSKIERYINEDAVDKALEKQDRLITKENVKEVKYDMRVGFAEIKEMLNSTMKINKRIEANTK